MINQVLGHYRILEKIGAGGMGVVYRAHDEQLGRDVALKILPPGTLADDNARQQLRQEALALSRLNHPHICVLHEIGEAQGQTYIAMEFVEGKPLNVLVRREGLRLETVARYGAQIAEALAHAHERGVIHRDLKSANVIITPEGRAKVLDFGLARRVVSGDANATRSEGLTKAESVVGTLHYIAPEVLRGEAADARSDVWALGVMLYEAVTGALPFQGKTGFDVSSAILRESPAPLDPRAPAGLRAAIQRCLAKERGERYQRASEVQAVLEAMRVDSVTAGAAPARRPLPLRWLGLAVLLVLLLTLAAAFFFSKSRPPRIESLAVLPLENLSHDPEQDYFTDGMTEQLITSVAQIGALRVISRTSVMRYKRTEKAVPQIARELNVDAVVEGSVQRSGNRVRITAQLIEASTDRHLWAKSYERDLRDTLALQNDVAQAIADEISVKLTPQEQTRLATARSVNPEAQEAYLKGRFYWRQKADIRKSFDHLQQAVEKDPRYAPAYAALADSYGLMALGGYLPADEAYTQWKAAASKALELDDTLAEAHSSLAALLLYHDWNWKDSEREFKRAIQLNPNLAEAHQWYSDTLAATGRLDEARGEIRRAQQLDPFSPSVNWMVGHLLFQSRRYDEAIDEARKMLDIHPEATHAILALAHTQKKNFEQAMAEAQMSVKPAKPGEGSPALLGQVRAAAGRKSEALQSLDELKAFSQRHFVPGYDFATIYAALREKDRAFEWLEKAYHQRPSDMLLLKVDPRMDPLRSDPRFAKLMARMGLTL